MAATRVLSEQELADVFSPEQLRLAAEMWQRPKTRRIPTYGYCDICEQDNCSGCCPTCGPDGCDCLDYCRMCGDVDCGSCCTECGPGGCNCYG